jgi:hypothetical protein
MTTRSQPAARAVAVPSWPRGWRAAAGLTAVAAGALIITGALLPWVEAFAGLLPISGIRGGNGRELAAMGAVVVAAGIWQLARGGQAARWLVGLAGFAAAGFSGYLLIQLVRTVRGLGGDSMVLARPGPGLPVVLAASLAAFATLLFPPSAQATLRRDPGARAFSRAADRESAGLRRALQIALGAVWLLDAALQYQPYMFTRGFPGMLAMAAAGQPGIVAGPVALTVQAVSASPAAWNAAFATIQLALAVGLLFRATARAALAGTIVWALSVWWLGEGLGGVLTTAASPLTGAPGAAVLYALLAVLAWPGGREERPGSSVADGSPLGRYAKLPWLLLWAGMACLMAMTPHQAPLTVIAFTAAFAAVAAGVWNRSLIRPALIVAAIAAVVIWVAGEQFGALFTGQATDPNTGPLLILIAAAFWPLRGHDRLRESAALVRGNVLDFPERARGSSRTSPAALAGGGVEVSEVVAEAVRGAGLAPGRGDDGDRAASHYPAAGRGQRCDQSVVLGGRHVGESAGLQVRPGTEAQVSAVHMRVGAASRAVAPAERGARSRRVPGPVGNPDRARHRVPALVGEADLLLQPATRDEGVGVRRGQPDVRRIQARGPAQHLPRSRRARRADAVRADRDDGGAAAPRDVSGPVAARVGHHDQLHGHAAHCPRRPAQAAQARRQQFLLVVRRDDHADGPDHTIPPTWATDLRSPPARVYTSAAKSGSRYPASRASPGCPASAWCASSPVRG